MSKFVDTSNFRKSSFTVTFVYEVTGLEVYHDCNEGWLDLGPCVQGLRLQYQLYPGQNYDIDVLIWPHCAKLWCGGNSGWVRTWQFFERRWIAFSIRHAFPVRIVELQKHIATISPSFGMTSLSTIAKNDKNSEIFLPPLKFGEKRYFGPVEGGGGDNFHNLLIFIRDLIWSCVVDYIPASVFDGVHDVPNVVSDKRHQDTVIEYVQLTILNQTKPIELVDATAQTVEDKTKKEDKAKKEDKKSKSPNKDKKSTDAMKMKFELRLSGDDILAGIGRVVPFETLGTRPTEVGEMAAFVSSNDLPARDDFPMVFVNVDKLFGAPIEEMKRLRITHLYIRWCLGDEEHSSLTRMIGTEIDLKDHHALPIVYADASGISAQFLDKPFDIELRGIRSPDDTDINIPKLFGFAKSDKEFDKIIPKIKAEWESDIAIAVCKVDTERLAQGINSVVRGEFPLYPAISEVKAAGRESMCTNDINAIRAPLIPAFKMPPFVVLEAQMTLEVSIGFVGCRFKNDGRHYSRIFCTVRNQIMTTRLIHLITSLNHDMIENCTREDLLTGFAVHTGNLVFIYLEGPKDKNILKIWDLMEGCSQWLKANFSTVAKYKDRLYPDLVIAALPFICLKMYAPLNSLLICPPIYVRPALPLPARAAVLKLGRILSSNLKNPPSRQDMPTFSELRSFRIELCSPSKPAGHQDADNLGLKLMSYAEHSRKSLHSTTSNINWDK